MSSLVPTLSCSVSLGVRAGWELQILVLSSVGSTAGAVTLQRLCPAVERDVEDAPGLVLLRESFLGVEVLL